MFDEKNEKTTENTTGELTTNCIGEEKTESCAAEPTVEAEFAENTVNAEDGFSDEIVFEYEKKKKKKKGFVKPIAVTAACACVAGFVFGVSSVCTESFLKKTTDVIQSTQNALVKGADASSVSLSYSALTEDGQMTAIENIVDACLPSVVSITNKGVAEVATMFGNYKTESVSSGSGIIIGENDTELLIVTNYHVVSGSNELTVVFAHEEDMVQDGDTSNMNTANVKGYDADKDIAVIAVKLDEISEETRGKIRIATIGNSDEVKLGSGVVAIGNALGYGQSVTHGIISALDREVTLVGADNVTITNKYIQTDAAINSGNSGGALLNMKGELIGINSAKIKQTGVESIGYAIPISDVQDLIADLMTQKTRNVVDEEKRGYLGIYGTDVTSQVSQAYGMPMGVFVKEIIKNSPADKSNLEQGDIIVKVDGSSVTNMTALQSKLSYYEKGEAVTLKVKRIEGNKYVEKDIEVVLGSKDESGIDN